MEALKYKEFREASDLTDWYNSCSDIQIVAITDNSETSTFTLFYKNK